MNSRNSFTGSIKMKSRLLEKMRRGNPSQFHVTLLPDFFLDRFLYFDEIDEAFEKIGDVYDRGGGNLPNVRQSISHGGDAANTAIALSRLGVKAHLIGRTSELGHHLLKFFLERKGVDISKMKDDGELALTMAMEFGKEGINVMIGDVGSVKNFGFDDLDDDDLDLIASSDMVFIGSWNLNMKGTDLAQNTFKFAKKHDVKTFLDSGDPSFRKDLPELKKALKNNLDILAISDDELKYFAPGAVELKKEIYARIDLPTQDFSMSIDDEITRVNSIPIKKKYLSTGAGDAWNAGDIFGELAEFAPDERLLLANIVAGVYISSPQQLHPDLKKIKKFLSEKI